MTSTMTSQNSPKSWSEVPLSSLQHLTRSQEMLLPGSFRLNALFKFLLLKWTHWLQLNVSGHCRIHALPNTKGTSDYTLQSVLYFNFIWRKREAVTFKKRNFTSTTHQKEAADLHLILIVSEGLSEAPSYRDQRKRVCVFVVHPDVPFIRRRCFC